MQLRPLGSTGLRVTPIGLGLAALGRPGYLNLGHASDLEGARKEAALRARCHEVLDAAYDAGVRYIDAARSYGKAEEFLAEWLQARSLPPGAVTVGSKWGYTYTAGWRADAQVHEVKDHSLAALRRQAAESRRVLGDHLNLYQVHSATLESGILRDRPVLEQLAALAADGLVVGLSVSGPRQADVIGEALAVDVSGVNPFRVIQATWNILEPSAGPALAAAAQLGWGVIVKEGVANGRLAGRQAGEAAAPAVLAAIAARRAASPDAVALAAVLAQPWVAVALSGAATVPQMGSNLAALAVDLRDDDVAELLEAAEDPQTYWEKRGGLAWT